MFRRLGLYSVNTPLSVSHEDLSRRIIESDEMKILWGQFNIHADQIAKLAVGPEHYSER